MITNIRAATGLLVTVVSLSMASESFAKNRHFGLRNDSGATIESFTTYDSADSDWTANWLEKNIGPGEEADMDFNSPSGDCAIVVQIYFTDGKHFQQKVDFCKAKSIVVKKSSISAK
jgi:hypothetical protein